jgi:hypothetical protein
MLTGLRRIAGARVLAFRARGLAAPFDRTLPRTEKLADFEPSDGCHGGSRPANAKRSQWSDTMSVKRHSWLRAVMDCFPWLTFRRAGKVIRPRHLPLQVEALPDRAAPTALLMETGLLGAAAFVAFRSDDAALVSYPSDDSAALRTTHSADTRPAFASADDSAALAAAVPTPIVIGGNSSPEFGSDSPAPTVEASNAASWFAPFVAALQSPLNGETAATPRRSGDSPAFQPAGSGNGMAASPGLVGSFVFAETTTPGLADNPNAATQSQIVQAANAGVLAAAPTMAVPNFSLNLAKGLNQQATTTSIIANTPSVGFGDNASFTAHVTPNSGNGVPTGMVLFWSGQQLLGIGQLDSTGWTTFSTSMLPLGNVGVTAQYFGDFQNAGSSASTTETIGQASTTVILTETPTVSSTQGTTFMATVVPTNGAIALPTGSIAFVTSTGTVLGTVDTIAGMATFTTSAPLPSGTTVSAVYNGDNDFLGNTSQALDPSNPVVVTSNIDPATPGQTVTLTCTVTGSSGSPATGNVTFYAGSTNLGTVALSNTNGMSQAQLTTSSLPAGVTSITAVYSGDSTHDAGSSAILTQVVRATSLGAMATSTNGPSPSFPSVTLSNSFGNAFGGVVNFHDENIQGSDNTLFAQFKAYFNSLNGVQIPFFTFCIDLTHTVYGGQNYLVNPSSDLTSHFNLSNDPDAGSRIEFIYRQFGMGDLQNDAIHAAAVQIAIWDLMLNHNPMDFVSDGGGTYSGSTDEGVFNVNLGTSPNNADQVAQLVQSYLQLSAGATDQGNWLDASPSGGERGRGQSLLTPEVSVTGTAFVAAEGQQFKGVVADIAPNLSNPNGNYATTILWGDGASSTGTLQADGKGGYFVLGTHTYAEESSYPVAVLVTDLNTGATGVGLTFGLVLTPDNDAIFQEASGLSLSYNATATQSGLTAPDSYNLTTAGTLNYSFDYTLNNIGSEQQVQRAAIISFSVSASGTTEASFTLGTYNLSDTGDESANIQTQANDLVTNSQTTENDANTINFQKSGSGIGTASFTASWNNSTSFTSSTTGTDDTGSFAGQGSGTLTQQGTENGDYTDGNYTLTETDTSNSTQTTAGNHDAVNYSSTINDSSSFDRVQSGNIFGESFTLTDTGTDTYTSTETDSDAAGGDTQSGSGNSSFSRKIQGDDPSGDFNLTQTTTGSDANQESGNALTETFSDTSSDTYTSTTSQVGNTINGNYTGSETTTSGASSHESTTDQTDGTNDIVGDNGGAQTLEQGNIFSRDVTRTTTTTDTTSDQGSDNNQDNSDNTTTGSTAGSSTTTYGNEISGDYTINSNSTDNNTSNSTDTNQTNTDVVKDTDVAGTVTTEKGNDIDGSYSLQTTETDQNTQQENDTNQTDTQTGNEASTSKDVINDSGNHIDGTYNSSSTETDSSSGKQTDNNQTNSDTNISTSSDTVQDSATGNRKTGAYSETKSSNINSTDAGNDTNQSESDTSNDTTTGTVNEKISGNSVTTDMSETITRNLTTTEANSATNQGDVTSGNDTNTTNETEQRTSNALTGNFTDTTSGAITSTGGGTETDLSDTQTSSGQSTTVTTTTTTGDNETGLVSSDSTSTTTSTSTGSDIDKTDFQTDSSTATDTKITHTISNVVNGTSTTTTTDTTSTTSISSDSNQTDSTKTSAATNAITTSTTNSDAETGSFSSTEGSSTTTTGTTTEVNQATNDTSNFTTASSSTTSSSGDNVTGNTTSITISTSSTPNEQDSGVDSRGAFSGTSSSFATTISQASSDDETGQYTIIVTSTSSSSMQRTGGDASATYQLIDNSQTASQTQTTGDRVTTTSNSTTQSASSDNSVETGVYLATATNYVITTMSLDTSASTQTSNSDTGIYSSSSNSTSSSTTQEHGSNATGNFDLIVNTTSTSNNQRNGDSLSGIYSGSGSFSKAASNQEVDNHPSGSSSYTELTSDSGNTQENGNSITTDFSVSIFNGVTGYFMTDTGGTADGSFTVTENASGSYNDVKTGNSTNGSYVDGRTETDNYSMTEVGSDPFGDTFTLNLNGANGFQISENGNSVLATYNRTTNGSDNYSMSENGFNGGKKFSQAITGTDVYNVQELGNNKTGTFSRIDTGTDTYDLKQNGAGITKHPPLHGTLNYNDTETGDTRAGSFKLTKGGADRFSLLQFFIDVSNTGNGYTPGNMEFHPAGMPFTDGRVQKPPKPSKEDTREGTIAVVGWLDRIAYDKVGIDVEFSKDAADPKASKVFGIITDQRVYRSASELKAYLEYLASKGYKLTRLRIVAHGGPEGLEFPAGTDKDMLLVVGDKIMLAGQDVTSLLKKVLTEDATLELKGCDTGNKTSTGWPSVAQEASKALPGITVVGTTSKGLRVSHWSVWAPTKTFLNGEEQ